MNFKLKYLVRDLIISFVILVILLLCSAFVISYQTSLHPGEGCGGLVPPSHKTSCMIGTYCDWKNPGWNDAGGVCRIGIKP